MRANVIVGPGHHGGLLLRALRARGVDYRAVLQWPELTVEDWRGGVRRERSARWYRWQRRALWGVWRRLPLLGSLQTPRQLDCLTFDLAARRQLGAADVTIGWSQVSLRSLARARAQGIPTVLEHPTTHIDTWLQLVDQEYRRWPHGGERYSQHPRLLIERMRRECEVAEYISVLSSFAARSFTAAGISERRLLQLPLGVDEARFTPLAEPRPPGPLRLLYVGRLELLKGIPYLLQAVRGLADVQLTLIGPVLPEIGPVLARWSGPETTVAGPVDSSELPSLYQAADALVFPSVNDAMGLVLLEAMSCGLPVLATPHSGAPDIVDEGVDGFITPVGEVEALRARIVELRDQRDRRLAMGIAARQKVLRRFREADYAERLLAALARVARPGSGG